MADVLKVKLGVCEVFIGGTSLGHTIGGVEVTYAPEYHETKVDKYAGVAEQFLIGEDIFAKVPIAESTLANITRAITHSTQTSNRTTIGSNAGKRLSDKVAVLRLHPYANATGDRSEDVTIFRAAVTNEITISYKNDGERIIEAEFHGIIDEGRSDGSMLALIGDSLS